MHSVANHRGKEDADTARLTVQLSRLLAGLGVPHSVIGKLVATPPARITFLDNRDLAALNVHRTNPFRKIYDAASMARNQQANSVCNPGVDVETEAAAYADTGPARHCRRTPPQSNEAQGPAVRFPSALDRQASAAGLRMRPNRRRIGTAVRAVRNAPEDSRRDRQ